MRVMVSLRQVPEHQRPSAGCRSEEFRGLAQPLTPQIRCRFIAFRSRVTITGLQGTETDGTMSPLSG